MWPKGPFSGEDGEAIDNVCECPRNICGLLILPAELVGIGGENGSAGYGPEVCLAMLCNGCC